MQGIGLNCHFAGQQFSTAEVRYGSKADILAVHRHVRFTPKSGYWFHVSGCPLCAKSGHSALQRSMSLFDRLVGEDLPIALSLDDSFRKADQGERETEVECLRCSPVDH
jgi:hypothetical protein